MKVAPRYSEKTIHPQVEPGMKHLAHLRLAHRLAAAFCGLPAIAGFLFGAWFCYQIGKEEGQEAAGWIMMMGVGFGALVMLLMACLFLVSAKKVAQGKGRIFATAVSFTMVLGPGIVVTLYTLWVCWINQESSAVFAAGGIPSDPNPDIHPGYADQE